MLDEYIKVESLSALVTQGCYNRVPPTGGFRVTYYLTILEAGGLR